MALTLTQLQTEQHEMRKRLNRLESQQEILNKTVKELGSKYAYYWYNDRVKVFSVVTKLNPRNSTASIVGFSDGLSGGMIVEVDVPMFINNPLLPDDEQQREGKWEPLLDLSLILDELSLIAKKTAQEAESEDADEETSTETAPAA